MRSKDNVLVDEHTTSGKESGKNCLYAGTNAMPPPPVVVTVPALIVCLSVCGAGLSSSRGTGGNGGFPRTKSRYGDAPVATKWRIYQ
ncbi:hypothetical protein J6590_007022 [Homalodisca vitripennis]|nr:hypothetical protein J6590_007022 [Homalodisca vitripennis]